VAEEGLLLNLQKIAYKCTQEPASIAGSFLWASPAVNLPEWTSFSQRWEQFEALFLSTSDFVTNRLGSQQMVSGSTLVQMISGLQLPDRI
jgi:hypothetical protein